MLRSSRFTLALLAVALLVPAAADAGKKKKRKRKKKDEPLVGWHQEEGWDGACYHPPDFEAMASGPKRLAWQETRDNLMSQWKGEKGDGIAFKEKVLHNLETALLAKPERIEQVSQDNLTYCLAAMKGKGPGEWEAWIDQLPAELTAGECPNPPLDYTLFDYLNIAVEWQIPGYVCKDDHIKIKATAGDYYKITEEGEWINAAGDPNAPAGSDFPCNIEGCLQGQVIMRFTGESGVVTIKPVGTELDFLAPEHGKIEVMINDTTFYDNTFKVESGIEHHTGIEYSPVK